MTNVSPFFFVSRRAHTVTVLFILTCALVYVTLLEETPQDTAYNTKRSVGCIRHFLNVSVGSRGRHTAWTGNHLAAVCLEIKPVSLSALLVFLLLVFES